MSHAMGASSTIIRLHTEDAIGQLRRREGFMATLGSENGEFKLDWVEGVARLLADETKLEEVEAEARALWQHGIRHLIWAGMGGSIITVRVLAEMDFCSSHGGNHIAIYPLDSTDPAALNEIVRRIAQVKDLSLPTEGTIFDSTFRHSLLDDVMIVGVSMGMTSEEPITHLAWFADLLGQGQLPLAEHILVMTLPGSYLDQFACEHQIPIRLLQLDGRTGTGGRMSAPTTRIFLFPAALYLTRLSNTPGQLRAMLKKAWQNYNIDLATNRPTEHPFVQLAAALYDTSIDGACRLLIEMPEGWQPLVAWIEQLMEESLGKGKKGVVVFDEQSLNAQAPCFRAADMLHVRIAADESQENDGFTLQQPSIVSQDPLERLAAIATSFLGWQLSMALYGYLHRITFAGQPAVENYKARARALRTLNDPLQSVQNWQATLRGECLTLLAPPDTKLDDTPAAIFVRALQQMTSPGVGSGYLDFTFNGESLVSLTGIIATHLHRIGNTLLGIPVKLRHAPAAYHSTEQSEMDGPSYLISLRILIHEHEECIIGTYTDAFLRAQAISTWQAMIEQGHLCFLLIIDGQQEQAVESLQHFFEAVECYMNNQGML